MATTNPTDSSRIDALSIENIKTAAKEAGNKQRENNSLYKSAVKELDKMVASYENLIGKAGSLSKETINLKTLNNELQKAKQKDIIAGNKLAEINKKISGDQLNAVRDYLTSQEKLKTLEKNLANIKSIGNKKKIAAAEKNLNLQLLQTLNQEQALEVIELEYIAQTKAAIEGKNQLEYVKEALNAEEEIANQVGITGKILALSNKHLGIGGKLYSKIVSEARDGVKTTKNMVVSLAAAAVSAYALAKGIEYVGGKVMSLVGANEGGPISTFTSNFTELIGKIPIIGGLLAGFVDTMANVLDFAVGASSKIQEMGREVGLTKDQSIQLNNQFSDFATNSGKAYLNSEKLFKTYLDISEVLGVNNQISKENLQTQYELNKFLGVDAQTSAEIEKSSLITGKSSKSIAQSIFSQTKNLERATGISFNFQSILKEAVSLGGVLGLSFAKYPEKITNALLATKAMGLELKQLDGMADSFLDFESSISKEFEAQLLTGKDINLAKAREAFLNNDLATAAEEITKQVGSSGDFLKMNRIQQEALAGAMGMSRDQMADMLKQQEYLSRFNARDVKDLHEKVKLLRLQGKEQQAINLLGDKEAYNKMVTSTASEDLAGFIDKIKQSFADMVANGKLADFVQNTIKFLSEPDSIMKIVNKIKNVFATIVDVVGSVIGGIMKFLNIFPGINIDEGMISMVQDAGSQIRSTDLGSLSLGGAAAKDKVGANSTNNSLNKEGSGTVINNYNSPMGIGSVILEGRPVGVITTTAIEQGAQTDNQLKVQTK